jgi:hypothetical protein
MKIKGFSNQFRGWGWLNFLSLDITIDSSLPFSATFNNTCILVLWWSSAFIAGRENPDTLYNVIRRDHRPSTSELTNFLSHTQISLNRIQTDTDWK